MRAQHVCLQPQERDRGAEVGRVLALGATVLADPSKSLLVTELVARRCSTCGGPNWPASSSRSPARRDLMESPPGSAWGDGGGAADGSVHLLK
jgi:hypothetical protein